MKCVAEQVSTNGRGPIRGCLWALLRYIVGPPRKLSRAGVVFRTADLTQVAERFILAGCRETGGQTLFDKRNEQRCHGVRTLGSGRTQRPIGEGSNSVIKVIRTTE